MGIEINSNNKFECDVCNKFVILLNKRLKEQQKVWVCNDCSEKYPTWKT